MSTKEVVDAIREHVIQDESLQSPSRNFQSVVDAQEIASKASQTPPIATTQILVSESEEYGLKRSHYALAVNDGAEEMLVNLTKDDGYPLYYGDIDKAPGLLARMKPARNLPKEILSVH